MMPNVAIAFKIMILGRQQGRDRPLSVIPDRSRKQHLYFEIDIIRFYWLTTITIKEKC